MATCIVLAVALIMILQLLPEIDIWFNHHLSLISAPVMIRIKHTNKIKQAKRRS